MTFHLSPTLLVGLTWRRCGFISPVLCTLKIKTHNACCALASIKANHSLLRAVALAKMCVWVDTCSAKFPDFIRAVLVVARRENSSCLLAKNEYKCATTLLQHSAGSNACCAPGRVGGATGSSTSACGAVGAGGLAHDRAALELESANPQWAACSPRGGWLCRRWPW